MIINKQGKLFGKVSIIDILAIVAVLVLVVGVYMRFVKPDATSVDTGVSSSVFEYDIDVNAVRIGTVEALKAGGPVMDVTTKEEMGEIVSVAERPAYDTHVMADGTYRNAEVPDRYDVTVTVRVNGKISADGFYTKQNKQIAPGSSYTFAGKLAQTSGIVSDVREVTE